MSAFVRVALGASALVLLGAAKAPPMPAPTALAPLLQCRTMTDGAARLACYDGQVDSLKGATDRNEVIVVDRAQVQSARRSVFGLTLPSLSFLDRDDKGQAEDLSEITSKIASARQLPYGKWSMTLEDGARWTQIEPHDFVRDPKAGMPIVIKKAAMGSFRATIDGQIAVRVERDR